MSEDEQIPALATFDSSDEDGDDIANAYAMEYASSDDEKAWQLESAHKIDIVNKKIQFYSTPSNCGNRY